MSISYSNINENISIFFLLKHEYKKNHFENKLYRVFFDRASKIVRARISNFTIRQN